MFGRHMSQFLIVVVVFASISSEAQDTTQTVEKDGLSAGGSRYSMYKMIGGGVALGTIGFFAVGGTVGGVCEDNDRGDEDDLDCLGMAVLGAGIGESIGVALGVHAGNGRRGRLWVDAIVSMASLYGGVVYLNALENLDRDSQTETYILCVSGQLAAVIAAEKIFGWRQRVRKVGVSLRPYQGGKRKGILTLLSFPLGL